MDARLNQLAKIDDFERAIILAQYAHENGFRGGTALELYQFVKSKLDLTGLSNTAGLPEEFPEPNATLEATNAQEWTVLGPGKYNKITSGEIEIADDEFAFAQFDGTDFNRVLRVKMPGKNPTDEYDVETEKPLSGIAVGKGISKNFAGGANYIGSAEDVEELDRRVAFLDRPDLLHKHFIQDEKRRVIDRLLSEKHDSERLWPSYMSPGIVDRPDLGALILVDRDNKYIGDSGQSNKGATILPKMPLQFFNPSEQEPFNAHVTGDSTILKNYEELIADYDSVMASVNINPNITPYVSKRSVGKSVISDQDIFLYSFKPVAPKAKVLVVAGTHAVEKMYIHILRYFVRDLSQKWEDHPMLEYLRWNVQIDILPCRIPCAIGNAVTSRGSRIVPETEPFPVSWTKTGTLVTITFLSEDFPSDEYLNGDTYFTEVPSTALVGKTGIGIRTSSDAVGLPPNGYKIRSVINGRTITVTAPEGGQTSGTAIMQVYADPNRNFAIPEDYTSWNNYSGDNTVQNDDNGVSRGFMTDKGTRPYSLKDNRRFFELVMQEKYDHIMDLHSPADDHYLSYDSSTGFAPDLEILKEQSGAFVASPFRFLDRDLNFGTNFTASIMTHLGYPMWTPEWGGSGMNKDIYRANSTQVTDAYRWFIITFANALTKVINRKK